MATTRTFTVMVTTYLSLDAQYAIREINREIERYTEEVGRKLRYKTVAMLKGLEPHQITTELLDELSTYFSSKGITLKQTDQTCKIDSCDCDSWGLPHPAFSIKWTAAEKKRT